MISTACEKSNEPTGSVESGPPPGPVTITHAFGETTLTTVPERIVALGNQWLDTAQSLGITPIAYINDLTAPGSAPPPWEPATLKSARPLDTTAALTDQLAPLHPDLILADPILADAAAYADLTRIAPTIPRLTPAAVTPWPDLLRALAKVLHRGDTAERLITTLDARIAAIPRTHPTLKSATFTTTWLSAPTQLMVFTDPADPANTLLANLGLTIPAHLTDPTGRLELPPARTPELDADLLLAAYSPGLDETFRALPGFTTLPAVRKNATVFLTAEELSALNHPTALSLPYLLGKLEPALAKATK
ncbi:ABC transporter substrate-binding protein [Nocardia sp. NBC_01503]|uniref:ABC transporter substrate-binding protein n=1 Tax=Nocardia sp. NBC_01503 TaxID=2975997 RepID=UPI002E7B1D63|nr:ABC transporter substrate-binding protein [Nocardia sp. NBC_01503]WTL33989.1 ABC transporter substrate-binding protein [Nocardia sp. NBC_01503]